MSYCDRKLCSYYQEEPSDECANCVFNNGEFITGEGGTIVRRSHKIDEREEYVPRVPSSKQRLDPDSSIPILQLIYSIMMMKQRMIEKYGDLED